ncbi:MAG TPA: YceI family protein [Chloroflexota bacterium]|nr:YceI family protein [Chloroflexota bacterium]
MNTVTAPQTQTRTSTWQIDPAHTLVELSVKHMMFTTVKGRFTGVRGTIVDHADDPTQSAVQAEIDAATITTGDEQRDAHLKSADFLDVENYPTLTFTSTRIEGTRERFRVVGDLTIRGTSREVSLEAEFQGRGTNPYGKEVAGFTATTQLNRKDFGLTWNVALETGGVLVSDTIKVELDVQAVRQEA